jgi:toxin ParE1/3/4
VSRATISFAKSALEDLNKLRRWYAEQLVPDVGQRLVAEIFARIETLQNHPEMGRMVPEFGLPFLRELIQPPFRVVYRQEKNRVRVVRIWRSERLLQLRPGDTAA